MNKDIYVQSRIEDGIGILTLNRPEVLNAINRPMVNEILHHFQAFDSNEEVKAIVLSGKGRAFAAGADINEMADDDAISMELRNQFLDWDQLALIKKPIIGAVHGFVLGGGFELALLCDILLAAENTEFGFPEVNLAVMPGAGGTVRLTKILGAKKALEWLLTGERMTAKDALAYGIINRIIAPELLLEESLKLAKIIASKPPLSVRLIKESVNKAVDYSLYEAMQYERKNFYLLFASDDQKEGMRAFIEKRSPKFTGR